MKVSVQLYTVRDDMNEDPKGTLKRLGNMGFKYVELAGTAGLSVIEFKDALDEAGLKVSGMHVGLDAAEAHQDALMADAMALNTLDIIVPWVPDSAYSAGWDKLGQRLNKLGEQYHYAGFRLGYHNHAFEFVNVDGRPGLDILFENTDVQSVRPQLDLWWVLVGGQDPADYTEKYKARIPILHLKDGKDLKSTVHCGLGDGIQKWDPILKICRQPYIEFGTVELDQSDNPMRDVEAGLKYLRANGFHE